MNSGGRLGQMLLDAGLLSRDQLERALKVKLSSNKLLGEVILELGLLDREQMSQVLDKQMYERVRDVLRPMSEAELALAELYLECSRVFPDDGEFWVRMRNDELRHAEVINEMIGSIYENPVMFTEGRQFKAIAIRTFLDGIRQSIDRIRRGEIPREKVFYIVRDLEKSIIEDRYLEAVRSVDDRYNSFIRAIAEDEERHKRMLEKKIESLGL